ncbi:hypothetical protein Rxycam_03046 [Rubrobacter xylanophilus DSM 9941]|uniref:hypothetical protein n=1 Tax=Rubrobacter xylanophilus TaxID=49319 RepID=UPI001C641D5E|nr:hypothetical protein [Rubrobacter xylanophilus]QYJ17207.1 hypothetical protein Rxycam_03046 [Rubrobacter xylanophilus DSM 9941]
MSFLLSLVGALFLLVTLAGIALGIFMSMFPNTRRPGAYFALWWVSGAAAATGVLMRDPVTFAVGLLCFCVAGAAFATAGRGFGRSGRRRSRRAGSSEKTTRENRTRRDAQRRRAAS